MSRFFRGLLSVKNAKEDPNITNYLANSDAFKRLALNFHSNKTSVFDRI